MKQIIHRNKTLLTFILILITFQPNFTQVTEQNTKEERCDRFFDNLQLFYRECYDTKYMDMFSPVLVDTFKAANTNHEDEMARLDVFLAELANNPNHKGYVVVYGAKVNMLGEYEIRTQRVINYVLKFRKFDSARLTLVNGGFREQFEFELWHSRIKNAFPPLSPTILPEKVKYRGKMKPFGP